jgi:Family of unknown function (DUF5335)
MRRELDKAEWGPFLDRLSRLLSGSDAQSQCGSLLIIRAAVTSAPVIGVSYDPKDDEVEMAFEPLDHLVHRPAQLFVDETKDGLTAIEVVDAEGTRHMLEPAAPLPIPDEAI